MSKLLGANLERLKKDKVFWLALLVMLGGAMAAVLNGCRQALRDMSGYQRVLEDYYFNWAPVIGVLLAVVISLYLGTEYSDGTVRNKIVVGHTRLHVYLANLLTCFVMSAAFVSVLFLGGLVGIPTLGTWKMGASGLALYFVVALLFTAALAALFNLVGSLCSSKATGAVACILLALVLLVVGSMLYNRLSEPEMISGGIIITDEGMQLMPEGPNPDYVGSAVRQAYLFVLNLLPAGQAILMANTEITSLVPAAYSVAFLAVTALAGYLLFNRKDLK